MARFYYAQNSFSSGEISPKLRGRTDIDEYRNGLDKLRNFLPTPAGGVARRPGFRLLSGAFVNRESSSNIGRSFKIPFISSRDRWFYVELNLRDGDPDNSFIKIFRPDGTEVNTTFVQTGVDSQLDKVFEDVYGFNYAQVDNFLAITHRSGEMAPIIVFLESLQPFGESFEVFLFNQISQSPENRESNPFALGESTRYPFSLPNTTSIELEVDERVLGESGTITASEEFFYDEMIGEVFLLDDEIDETLRFIAVKIDSTSGTLASPSTTAGMTVMASSDASYPLNVGTDYWYDKDWSERKGYPRVVTAFENRLYFANSPTYPNKIWATRVGVISHAATFLQSNSIGRVFYERAPATASFAFSYGISTASGSSGISWFNVSRGLVAGTENHEVSLTGGDSAISATTVPFTQINSYRGGAPIQTTQGNDRLFFVSGDRKSIIEYGFFEDNGSFSSRNLSVLSDDIMHEGKPSRDTFIVRIAWQPSRSTLWVLASDAQLYSLSVNRETNVTAWAKHDMPQFRVLDIFVGPKSIDYDHIYVVLQNKAEGDNEHTEIIAESGEDYSNSTVTTDLQYMDTATTVAPPFGAPGPFAVPYPNGTILDGLSLDGTIYKDLEVSGSSIPNPDDLEELIVGVSYESELITLPLEVGPNFMLSSQGDIFRIDQSTLNLYNAWAGQYGSITDGEIVVYDIEQTDGLSPLTKRIPVDIPSSSSNDTKVIVKSDKPFPISILSILMRGQNYQG